MNQNKTMMVLRAAPVVSTEERVRILTEWTDSGLSARAYGQRTGVPVPRLYWWRRRLAGTPPRVPAAVPFVEVPPLTAMPSEWGAEVMTRVGAVRLSSSVAPGWAAQLVRELNRC